MLLYCITDRRGVSDRFDSWLRRVQRAGVDWIQVREKDLPGGALWQLVQGAYEDGGGKVLINERVDMAAAADLDGVHLPSDSVGAARARRILGERALIGVSCHGVEDVRRAASEGADFAVFGPVFDTPSKRRWGTPLGLGELSNAARAVSIPVLALGGVSPKNARDCRDAGAAGVAGISMFQGTELERTVEELHRL
ncbi:MAG: thiamine phosphate synthase [Acidobacteria bacterium]|nr:thiamine phosphate synthase [Acidobacteriota bacterium]